MNIKTKIALVVAVIALLFLVGWSSKAQNSSGRWEYKLVTIYGHPELPLPNLNQFNDLGDEGWELVTIGSEGFVRGGKPQTKLTYYFKRRR